jgi:hypothetical protein
MSELIKINNQQLPVKEYNGKRVVTLKEIDTVHGRTSGTARRSFNVNKKRFIEGIDYFVRNSYEARNEYGIAAPNGLVLITESGYLMLAKSFTDDLAWQVQRELVNSYFRSKTEQFEPEQLTLETAEYHYYPKTWHGNPVITAADFAHFTGMSKEAVYPYFHKNPNFETFHYRHLKNAELRAFKAENPSVPRCIADLYIITRKGCECMLKHFGLAADIPILEQKQEEPLEQRQKREEPAIQPRKVFTAAEYIAALEILNDLRLKFKEELESKNCMFPSTTKQNLEAVCRAMGHVSIPLITIGQNDKVI